MILHGLYHLISTKRAAAGVEARASRRPECDPRLAYEKACRAEKLAVEAEGLAEHARGNEDVMENINKLLHYLATSKHKSRYRNLTMTDLESAINWLRRENGDSSPEVALDEAAPPQPETAKPAN